MREPGGLRHLGSGPVSATPARTAAVDVVRRVRERGAFSNEVLDAVLRRRGLDPADRAFATRLAYGTIQYQGVLDEVIDRHSDRPGSIDPRVRDVLRTTAYELLLMRTPARAAVHQGVEAARAAAPRAGGFANAVLRRIAEEAEGFPWGDPDTDTEALARVSGSPLWLVRRLLDDLGEDTARTMLAADSEPAPLYLWHNPFAGGLESALDVLERDGAAPEAVRHPGCIRAGSPAAAVSGRAVAEELVLVSDAAAQVAPLAASPRPGDLVVDIGAGRGTKTVGLQAHAVEAGGPAEVLAVDLHDFKLEVLAKRARRLTVPGVDTVRADATDPRALGEALGGRSADIVLLDAPCSGTGVLRRHPERHWTLSPEDVERLARLQSALLTAAASVVSEDGAIIYATCTVTRRENEEVVAAFLSSEAGADFSVRPLHARLSSWWDDSLTLEGYFRSHPTPGGPDGHFVARLVRDR